MSNNIVEAPKTSYAVPNIKRIRVNLIIIRNNKYRKSKNIVLIKVLKG